MKALDSIINNYKSSHLFEGSFGLEKENIRIDKNGKIALTPHPSTLGSKLTHPYITTDFSESQIEMITPPLPSIHEALGFLETIHDIVSEQLGDEYLWPQSTPPDLPENDNDIPIANYGLGGEANEEYRSHLANKYGKKKQLLSGIHYNFSFLDKNLTYLYQKSEDKSQTYAEFKEAVYLKVARNFLKYRWYLVTLLGDSPALHSSYMKCCIDQLPKATTDAYHFTEATSMRTSVCGYKNQEDLVLDYSSMDGYDKSIQQAIDNGQLESAKENYSPIRLKEINGQLAYLEIRLLDLDPSVKLGITKETAEIVHMFLLFCLLKEETTFDAAVQFKANENQEIAATMGLSKIAKIDFEGKPMNLQEAVARITRQIEHTLEHLLPEGYERSLEHLIKISDDINERPAAKTLAAIQGTSFLAWHLEKAQVYKQESLNHSYKFYGLEDMELSTQLLLREAVLRGIKFEIMDRSENFVKLEQNGKIEYVMQATRTSLDNYVSVLMMENKVMTKKLIERVGIRTPKGEQYIDHYKAKEDFLFYKNKSVVVKPKSTNFGLGISILKNNTKKEVFDRAIEIAFEHDNSILVEEFVSGKEYRIFIIKNEVVGILHRVPANVKGDGEATIRELVIEKNKDPLRGKGYKTPLEKIALGEAEEMFLQSQGLDFDFVPSKNQIVYLRENSNISTGGDSIDFTDDIPESYKKIAVDAAKALDVEITGLDMMIDDISEEANDSNYAIIEMNFNPAIHIHCYPYKGKNRRLNAKVLDALGY
ncbi:bifunctional glutamate--cysteine ligase GshA/glutathione synthetase GshB [Flammeovirga kamogawensis]|uniref:Glutamate--cysteine ligase n=1 Tax=Flammeovirga kamogawensis TaxID=373891 RepID=A0ABX8H371_9BACT|nr:bifunctional glutamate--cysteine ligase GshA/glutathione synthetase GshB [Flammeovirga kamogawensis]MBB6463615.1 glutamate--cysteine ligase [Flammeovirga kamogawensis]QWG09837.1 bifunctional glutamate--cysteine ligase GshA/glutathione synthetase GshB [Flammeovirga kamogawensis]TRX65344.1 bifunctional glutamate--cysteine ligase GshA/glutathione synthetase GshB [Flammeovirga kamogawensis]